MRKLITNILGILSIGFFALIGLSICALQKQGDKESTSTQYPDDSAVSALIHGDYLEYGPLVDDLQRRIKRGELAWVVTTSYQNKPDHTHIEMLYAIARPHSKTVWNGKTVAKASYVDGSVYDVHHGEMTKLAGRKHYRQAVGALRDMRGDPIRSR